MDSIEERAETAESFSGPRIYTVSELTSEIKSLLEESFDFVWVEGEISNFRSPISGHYYMVLKDDQAQIRAVMFRPQIRYLRFMPEDGMRVIARGRIGVYAPRGEYQVILDYLEPLGVGALALAFEQLKKKLASEGVFDPDRKRPLPFLPQRVAVITSPTGAAIRDFLKVITRRFANLEIIVIPVRVQGEEATAEIIEALEIANTQLDVDVIVITRGGGSLEDLWAFNKEELAYAIRKSTVPVVSAVGHEIDTTICDLASDLRAPTPSAAAEMLVKEKESLEQQLGGLVLRMISQIEYSLDNCKDRLAGLRARLRDPQREIADKWIRLDEILSRLARAVKWNLEGQERRLELAFQGLVHQSPGRRLEIWSSMLERAIHSIVQGVLSVIGQEKARLEALQNRVSDLSPLSILDRGYSITMKLPEAQIIRSYMEVQAGDKVGIVLAKGYLKCDVQDTRDEQFPQEKDGEDKMRK